VDKQTHCTLLDLTEASGASLMDTVREAAEALRRQRFARQVADEMASLRGDPAAWADYLADAESTAVSDGVDR
jgi:hypothetical protein